MATREDLISRTLENLGVLAAGQAASPEDRAVVDERIEPVLAELLDDEVIGGVSGDEVPDGVYLRLAAILAEACMAPFGIGGQRAQMLQVAAEEAKRKLRLAYRVYDAPAPMRVDPVLMGHRRHGCW